MRSAIALGEAIHSISKIERLLRATDSRNPLPATRRENQLDQQFEIVLVKLIKEATDRRCGWIMSCSAQAFQRRLERRRHVASVVAQGVYGRNAVKKPVWIILP